MSVWNRKTCYLKLTPFHCTISNYDFFLAPLRCENLSRIKSKEELYVTSFYPKHTGFPLILTQHRKGLAGLDPYDTESTKNRRYRLSTVRVSRRSSSRSPYGDQSKNLLISRLVTSRVSWSETITVVDRKIDDYTSIFNRSFLWDPPYGSPRF